MNRKQQGDIGVASAIYHYTQQGHTVCCPLTDNARYDLVVDMHGELRRIQVKTTGYSRTGVSVVELRTKGGNLSGVSSEKRITAGECDLVYVYCLDGTTYVFPADFIADRATLNLGKKVEEYKL